MDIKGFNKKLKKISALTDTGSDELQLSSLERDLILSYIRDLYDLALDDIPAHIKIHSKPTGRSENDLTGSQQPSFKTEEKTDSSDIAIVQKVSTVASNIVDVQMKKDLEELQSVKPIEMNKNEVESLGEKKSITFDADHLAELFADEKVTDLSDKLALSPVKDLTKSMGINERIFTQQELFGNNQLLFIETLQRLNNCHNFEEAKQYLIENIIATYDWTNEHKIKKAATFIKLVKRKFS